MGRDGETKQKEMHWKTQTMKTLPWRTEGNTQSRLSLILKELIKGQDEQVKITSEMPKEQNEI